MLADVGEPKAVKAWLLAFHFINWRVQKDGASFSCCTNGSSNLATAVVTVGTRVSVSSHLQEI